MFCSRVLAPWRELVDFAQSKLAFADWGCAVLIPMTLAIHVLPRCGRDQCCAFQELSKPHRNATMLQDTSKSVPGFVSP